MKNDRETVMRSTHLSFSGRLVADRIMKDNGVSIEQLCNLIGQLEDRIEGLERTYD